MEKNVFLTILAIFSAIAGMGMFVSSLLFGAPGHVGVSGALMFVISCAVLGTLS